MDVHHAKLDNSTMLRLTPVCHNKFKDHNAHAINNTTKPLTDVTTAQLVNSQITIISNKTVFAEFMPKTAEGTKLD
jgi:hypothetical protein